MTLLDSKPRSFRILLSCTLGTFLEFFDYTLYGYFAGTIGHLFFPQQQAFLQSLATWAIFAIGFFVRPLGAIIFGHFADKIGRRRIFPLTILFMAIPTAIIGFLPTFAMVGWLAPLLLLVCRIIQGLAISGEYNGASIYILENNWRPAGLLGALTPFSCAIGMLVASLLAFAFSQTQNPLMHWRLPFIIAGCVVGLVAWYLRRSMQETESFRKLQESKSILYKPLKSALDKKLSLFTNIICSAYMGSASYLLLVYMPTYLQQQFHFATTRALLFTSVVAFLEAVSALFFGWISDLLGRWQILLLSSLVMAIASVLIILQPSLTIYELLISLLLLATILGAFDGPLTVYLPELFKTNIRYSATTFGYNIGGAALGGMAPFILSTLLQFIHSPVLVFCAYLGILAILAAGIVAAHAWSQSEKVAGSSEKLSSTLL